MATELLKDVLTSRRRFNGIPDWKKKAGYKKMAYTRTRNISVPDQRSQMTPPGTNIAVDLSESALCASSSRSLPPGSSVSGARFVSMRSRQKQMLTTSVPISHQGHENYTNCPASPEERPEHGAEAAESKILGSFMDYKEE